MREIAVLFRVVLDHRALHEEGEIALENVLDTDLRVPEDRAFFGPVHSIPELLVEGELLIL